MATKTPAKRAAETEVALNTDLFSDARMRDIGSFEDAMRASTEAYGVVETITDKLGNGFKLMEGERDKDRLVGVTFVILHSSLHMGDFGEFASMALVTRNNERLIMNDGSTGIYYQIKELHEETGRVGGHMVPHGLRVSEYDTCPSKDGGCGRPRKSNMDTCAACNNTSIQRGKGQTYYFDTSD